MAEIESSHLAGNKRKYKMKCVVPNCEIRAASGLEKFPTEPLLRYTWLKLCGLSEIGEKARICHSHFEPSDFSTTLGKYHLLPTALPKLLLPDIIKENNFTPSNTTKANECLKTESSETNPWSVEDASVFLRYCCPECEFSHLDLQIFTNHALDNHNGAKLLFNEGIVTQGKK